MFQTCRISSQDVTRSDKYSLLSYVVLSCSSALTERSLRTQHHISGKTTFSTLCAGAHKVLEICQSGSEGGAKRTFVPTPIQKTRLFHSYLGASLLKNSNINGHGNSTESERNNRKTSRKRSRSTHFGDSQLLASSQ